MARKVKNLPAMQEKWIPSLGQEDPLEKGMATPTSILTWTEEPGGTVHWGCKASEATTTTIQGVGRVSCVIRNYKFLFKI